MPSLVSSRSLVGEVAERDDHLGLDEVELRLEPGPQAAISSGSGSRLPGGRHLHTLAM